MSTAQVKGRVVPESMPDEVDSPTGKLVYLYLSTAGRASVDELAAVLDIQKITLFSVLGTLSKRGIVERTERGYRLA